VERREVTDRVIRASSLKKVYRLYSKPSYRFRDMFGLLGDKPGAFTEHAALDGVTLEIRRGEKVAIIGRNGAGKSTFLKLVTKVIEPTSGEIDVKGDIHALLQIGTGFHPDFTGRENVYAYFAQLGLTGKEADRCCAEVVEFAEIEEYIDQPMKTYSTGMTVRLMFSASTAIKPDLLVLDEVLGVGDAYFAHKSYTRIRDLCDRDGTTLLLVSHDIYTAAKICNRMIWLDHGRVMVDLAPPDALKVYENSIRLQEEQRLRKKAAAALRQAAGAAADARSDVLLVEIAAHQPPAAAPAYFSRISVQQKGEVLAEAPFGAQATSERASLVSEGTAWSAPIEWDGRATRSLLQYGSPFHKVAVVFYAPGLEASARSGELTLDIDYATPAPVALDLRAFLNGRDVNLGALPPASNGWTSHRARIEPDAPLTHDSRSMTSPIGTGAMVIRNARLIDEDGRETYVLQHGRPARLEIDFEVIDPALAGPVGVGVAILRGGVETACRFFTCELCFDGQRAPHGTIEMSVRENWLGVGAYSLTVMLTRDGYAERSGHTFFAISPDVYACVRDLLEFEVRGGNLFATGTPVLARGEWTMRPRQT
jgi:ABC-type polysaccharide/polyol phosphate transport system ATPase subunit